MKKHSDRELADAHFYSELLRAYMDSANDAIFVLCDEMKFLACNRAMQEWLGQSEETLTRHCERIPITELLEDTDAADRFTGEFSNALTGAPVRFEMHIEFSPGLRRWVEFSMRKVDIEAGDMIITVARDVTEQHDHLDQIEYQARHDSLTGLINRHTLTDQLDRKIREQRPFQLILLDLDRFKEINDSLGHNIGDAILLEIAGRLKDATRDQPGTELGRMGGDEFAAIIDSSDPGHARDLANRIKRLVSEPLYVDSVRLAVDGSIGISLYPQHGDDSTTLLKHGEIAMYAAKKTGDGISIYSENLDTTGIDRLTLVADLQEALREQALDVAFQPIVPMQGGGDIRAEALARWTHPQRGAISPVDFIELAEHTGMIRPLTDIIFQKTLSECRNLVTEGALASISANLSPRLFNDPDLFHTLRSLLRKHSLAGERITLEITESAMMQEYTHAEAAIEQLRELGFKLAIDDFGTGHSSLQKLKHLPLTFLKIDKSFVFDMRRNDNDNAIINATIQMAHSLGLKVVAEGVEDEATWISLQKLGCDYAQGYWIARPMPVDQFRNWITSHSPAGIGAG